MENISNSVKQAVLGTKDNMLATNEQFQNIETTVSVANKLNDLTLELDGVMTKLKNND
ncbi:hypothetical protein [Oceanobacillus bengalensis]